MSHFLRDLTTDELARVLAAGRTVLLQPLGSMEPHGPHLPLGTDAIISEHVAIGAADRLKHSVLIAPTVPYGVTDYAAGFAGAISVPAAALSAFLAALTRAYLDGGFAHVCLINNHLEPDHDAAVRAAARGFSPGEVSVACPLTRRWGRTLSAEYKSGACHAGRYETSLVLAATPALVQRDIATALPPLDISLAAGIQNGLTTFRAMGIDRAYTGAPAEASAEEGAELYERLVTMVVTEVEEALSARSP